MRAPRRRAVLAAAVLLPLVVGPLVAQAVSPPVDCPGASRSGTWQRLPVEGFRGVESVSTRDVVSGYAVDAASPQRLLATNGNTLKLTASHGCAWTDVVVLTAAPGEVALSGTTSTIVSAALLPGGPALAAVREGTGPASRPHVAASADGRRGTWALSDSGLPASGAPLLLEAASDGRTAYLVLGPTSSGDAGGIVAGLPGVPGGTGPVGLLYATADGGRSWTMRTAADALPSGSTGFDAVSVDVGDPALLYAVAGGRLVVSRDGGRSLTDAGLGDVTAVEAMEAGEVVAATGDGALHHSTDRGASFRTRSAPAGIRSLAYRSGDDAVVAEGGGALFLVNARRQAKAVAVPAGVAPSPGSTIGDRGRQASFHALAGHSVLRWVDPQAPSATGVKPPVVGELSAPPPPPGRVAPASQAVRLQVGNSRTLDYTLVLPPSPTPLDLFFLIDTSPDMGRYIDEVKRNVRAITSALTAAGIDVKVGVGTTGPGPKDGEAPYPAVDPTVRDYRQPHLYRLLRPIGDVDAQLQAAFDGVQIESAALNSTTRPESTEGQLLALRQLVTGDGVLEQGSTAAAPRYLVPPGQQAGFRPQQGIRRLVLLATDENFNNPHGTPRTADGRPDLAAVGALLKAARVQQAGFAPVQGAKSVADLRTMAALTGTRAPAGGLDCGDGLLLAPGEPLVCDSPSSFTRVITDLVRTLVDQQDARLVARGASPVLGSIAAGGLARLDVTRRQDLPFSLTVSCLDVKPGTYTQAIDAQLRGFTVASATARVTCVALPAGAAALPPRPRTPAVQQDPVTPVTQAVNPALPPPAPAPPVVQPQAQPQVQAQTQAQLQPLTSTVLQQQEELQLALALQAGAPGEELAMVDRRRGEELRARALLAASMAAVSTLGLARLRTRPRPARARR